MARTANARMPAVTNARVRFRDKRPRYSLYFANQLAPRPGAIYARPMAIAPKPISIRKSIGDLYDTASMFKFESTDWGVTCEPRPQTVRDQRKKRHQRNCCQIRFPEISYRYTKQWKQHRRLRPP